MSHNVLVAPVAPLKFQVDPLSTDNFHIRRIQESLTWCYPKVSRAPFTTRSFFRFQFILNRLFFSFKSLLLSIFTSEEADSRSNAIAFPFLSHSILDYLSSSSRFKAVSSSFISRLFLVRFSFNPRSILVHVSFIPRSSLVSPSYKSRSKAV